VAVNFSELEALLGAEPVAAAAVPAGAASTWLGRSSRRRHFWQVAEAIWVNPHCGHVTQAIWSEW